MTPAFYCVCDARYFLGAVGMINSLRLAGHGEPIFVLDCGLRPEQRELLAAEATLVPAPAARPPFLLKTVAPLAHPADVMVLVDTDMIVTRPLTELIEAAAGGAIVAFADWQQRFCPEWGELPGLGEARPGPYVSSGLVLVAEAPGVELLELMAELQPHVDFDSTFWRENDRSYPYLYADQDVLNAILRTRIEPARLRVIDHSLAPTPPFRGVRRVPGAGLRCRYDDGTEPFVLHQFVRKPWLERTYHGAYSELLARALLGPDVAIRVPAEDVPLRMRAGAAARASRVLVNAKDYGRWHFWDRLPDWLGRRIEALRRRRSARRA